MDVRVEDATIVVTRDDGVAVTWALVDPRRSLPHDLGHLAVESTLGIRIGFWALVARGAMFDGMRRSDGRGRSAKSRRIVARRADRLVETERLVAAVVGWWRSGAGPVPTCNRDVAEIERCFPALAALDGRVRPFEVTWPYAPAATRS